MIQRNKLLVFGVSLLLSLCGVGVGVTWGEHAAHDPPTLTVAGQGLVKLAPDKAIVGLAVETAGKSLEDVQVENRDRMKRVLARLTKLGVEKKYIQTSSLIVTPHYPARPRRQAVQSSIPEVPKIIGYTVNNSLTVEVLDLDLVGKVVDGALQAGANRFSRVTWALRDERPARLEALKIAAQKAKKKAGVLAEALNVKLMQLLMVNEGGTDQRPQRRQRGRAMMSMAMEDTGSVPVSPGELTIHASVSLVYEIVKE